MLNKLEVVMVMVLHSVDQDMILAVHHMEMLDLILVDIVQLAPQHIQGHSVEDMISADQVPQHMLDLLEELILVTMDKILAHKLVTISVDMDKILEAMDTILVHKQVMISEVHKQAMILEVHKLAMILEVQDMEDMMQMHNKSDMDHMNNQELEMVDGKYHQVMEQLIHIKALTVIQQVIHQELAMSKVATTISSLDSKYFPQIDYSLLVVT